MNKPAGWGPSSLVHARPYMFAGALTQHVNRACSPSQSLSLSWFKAVVMIHREREVSDTLDSNLMFVV